MKTQTFKFKSDAQLIKENKLFNNPTHVVNEFMSKIDSVESACSPQLVREMKQNQQQFQTGWEMTKAFNDISPLFYLISYFKEYKFSQSEMMGMTGCLPREFQIVFAKHFVKRR
jgi:hypothetical protein